MEDHGDADALDVLASEPRLAILRALAENMRDHPEERAMRFADLRAAVGMRDSGNFNYHLDRLTGWLVEASDDGYELTPRGVKAISTLAFGVVDEGAAIDPEPLDRPCPECGDPLTAAYEQGTFLVRCDDGHAIGDFLPADVARKRPVEAVVEHTTQKTRRYVEQLVAGYCALCEGPVERAADVADEAGMAVGFVFVCERCGTPYGVPVAGVALAHPATTWFAYERGVDLRERPWLVLEHLFDATTEQVATDPPRYAVDIEIDGDTLTLTVDDTPAVVDVEPSPDG